MSTQEKARSLMKRHSQVNKQRRQSMSYRTGSEVGVTIDVSKLVHSIQGKIEPILQAA
jgi:hypothetical protein